MTRHVGLLLVLGSLAAAPAFAQEPVRGVPKPTCDTLATPVVAVLADGDWVTVVIAREYKDSKDPSKTYTSTWFDMWRFVDGKADEHWDPATKP